MAIDTQARSEIEGIKNTLQQMQADTKTIDQVSAANRKIFVQQLGNSSVDINSDIDKTGLRCIGEKAGINGGNHFSNWRSTVSDPTQDSHFDIKPTITLSGDLVTQFTPTADAASEVFTLTSTDAVKQVWNNGISLPSSQWSQSGTNLTVTPLDGGLFSDGYVQSKQ